MALHMGKKLFHCDIQKIAVLLDKHADAVLCSLHCFSIGNPYLQMLQSPKPWYLKDNVKFKKGDSDLQIRLILEQNSIIREAKIKLPLMQDGASHQYKYTIGTTVILLDSLPDILGHFGLVNLL